MAPPSSPTTASPSAAAGLPPEALTTLAPGLAVVPLRSPTLPPATHTNCWVLGEDEVIVVDPASPWPQSQQALIDALGPRRVRAVLLTHHHVDHVSGAAALVQATGAPLWAHAETAARLDLPVDRLLVDGDRLLLGDSFWIALHTPGHAPGHLCLLRADDGEVIAGDMVAGQGTILLDPEDGDLEQYLASLTRLLALEPARLLPAHGPPLVPAQTALLDLLAHRHQRTAQIRDGLVAGPRSPLALAQAIYPQLDPAWQAVAARQVLTHLRWLRELGQAHPVPSPSGRDARTPPLHTHADGVHTDWTLAPPEDDLP